MFSFRGKKKRKRIREKKHGKYLNFSNKKGTSTGLVIFGERIHVMFTYDFR